MAYPDRETLIADARNYTRRTLAGETGDTPESLRAEAIRNGRATAPGSLANLYWKTIFTELRNSSS